MVELDGDLKAALVELGYKNECCQINIKHTVDLMFLRDMYDNADAAKPPNFARDESVRFTVRDKTTETRVQAR